MNKSMNSVAADKNIKNFLKQFYTLFLGIVFILKTPC